MYLQRLACCVLLFCGAVALALAQAGTLTVFVSIPPQEFIVEKIGGNYVNVNVILPPGQSPETFEPSPKQLEDLSAADIYFLIDVPFEKIWTEKIREVNRRMKMVRTIDVAENNVSVDLDPHVWTSPANMKKIAKTIRDALVREDMDRSNYYEENYKQLLNMLDELDNYIKEKLSTRRTDYFIVSHASWGFFARDYGLKQIALETEGREAGPRSLARVLNITNEQEIRTLFVQAQYNTPVIKALAREIHGNVEMLDPLAGDYIENMMEVTDKIAESIR